MFVQYSFVQRRSAAIAPRAPIEFTPAMVMSAGVLFMAVTSIAYLLN